MFDANPLKKHIKELGFDVPLKMFLISESSIKNVLNNRGKNKGIESKYYKSDIFILRGLRKPISRVF